MGGTIRTTARNTINKDNMDRFTLLDTLRLDSLSRVLTWEERIKTHLYINKKTNALPPKVEALARWITDNYWEPPEMKYGQDRLLYFYCEDEEKYKPVEQFDKKIIAHPL